jgi:hypothetical protein
MPGYATKPSRMCDVYCHMKELLRMDALEKCKRGCESPPWVHLLLEASMKFEAVRRWLTDESAETFDFKYPDAGRYVPDKYEIDKREETILRFSECILMCQALFPGPVVCCKHIIADFEHLNVICHHCRYFQMRIWTLRESRKMCAIHDDFECRIRRLERAREKDSDSDSDFSDEDEWKRDEENWKRGKGGRTSLVFVTQHTNVTSQSDSKKSNEIDKSDVEAPPVPSRASQQTQNVTPAETDETNQEPSAPPSDGSQKADDVPIYRDKYYLPIYYNQFQHKYDKDENAYGFGDRNVAPAAYKQKNDSKLEVQSLLRMLQTSPY